MSNFDSFAVGSDGVFNFDTPIIAEVREFVLLPEGEYPFMISNIEKKRYEPKAESNAKLPPCPQIIVTFDVDGGESGKAQVKANFYYHESTMWRLTNLFIGVGLAQKNQQFIPNPDLLLGKSGRMKLKHHTYPKENGGNGVINEFDRCIAPVAEAASATQQNSFGGF